MNLIASIKKGPEGLLIIVTDKDILGKIFKEGKVQLDLTKEFYQGTMMNEEKIKESFQKARHLHLTGKEAVALGIKLNLVDTNKILYVKKIPHAEVVIE